MRRELSFYFDTVLNFTGSVTEHNFLLRCIPADAPEQSILSYTLTVYPDGAASLGRDSFGNVVRAGRVVEAEDIDKKLTRRTKILAVTQTSNAASGR